VYWRWILAAGLTVFLLAGCGDAGEEGTAESPAGEFPVRMVDDEFSPEYVEVPPGAQVIFRNNGRNPHNAVAVDGSFSTIDAEGGDTLSGDGTRVNVGDEHRAVRFYCTLHGTAEGAGMAGVLVVGEVSPEELAEATGVDRPDPVAEASGRTLHVPDEHATIQDAVDAAEPGDLVLVAPGTYHESVRVQTPSITIRGTARNDVILDGGFAFANGIAVYEADGVAVENMTARHYSLNGFYWTGVTGYRGTHLTAYNNADYGIYAFDATDGVFAHSYASGHPDAGFYVGQCAPCRTVLYDVVAEHNALGYSGTNAGGELYLLSSVWRNNRGGIFPNSLDSELNPPQRQATVVANLVVDNNSQDAVAKPFGYLAQGVGIAVGGGVGNVVARNVVVDHEAVGIAVSPLPDRNFWLAIGNEVRDNVVAGSGLADLALLGPTGGRNCFSGNRFDVARPAGLQSLQPCEGWRWPAGWDLSGTTLLLARDITSRGRTFTEDEVAAQPAPPPQAQMPGGADAPVIPALDEFAGFDAVDLADLAAVPLPDGANVVSPTISPEVTVAGLEVTAPGAWQLLFGFYAYLLPFALLAAWLALAFWDIARRDDLSRGAALGWVAATLLVPFLGVIAYHAASRSPIPGWLRAAFVAGGLAAYVLIVVVAAAVGGVL
jgi:plastocyanin